MGSFQRKRKEEPQLRLFTHFWETREYLDSEDIWVLPEDVLGFLSRPPSFGRPRGLSKGSARRARAMLDSERLLTSTSPYCLFYGTYK